MRTVFFILLFLACRISAEAQLTTFKGSREFYNGDLNALVAYFDNNYYNLDPIEGIWVFSKVEYDVYGNEVYNEMNFAKSAIVRDPGSPKRDFIEVCIENPLYNFGKVIYDLTKVGKTKEYTAAGIGWLATNTAYSYETEHDLIGRPGTPLYGEQALVVGVRQYPKAAPISQVSGNNGGQGNNRPSSSQVVRRPITHPRGWEPIVDWDNQIFPAYVLSTATADPTMFPLDPDYLGDPLSVLGIRINSPANNTKVRIEIEATKFTRTVSQEFVLPVKGVQYTIFPKVLWQYDLLRALRQPTPLDFVYKVSVNGTPSGTEYVTTSIRALNDCPLVAYDFRGEEVDLKFLFAAYVNEDHPKVDQLLGEALKFKIVESWTGYQRNEDEVIRQVYTIWRLLQERGFKYSSITKNSGSGNDKVFSQRVRLFEDAMSTSQANCVDGTVVFASFLRAIGIDPIIVTMPRHAFLGFYADANKEKAYYLETTMLGAADLSQYESTSTNDDLLKKVKQDMKGQASEKTFIAAINKGMKNYEEILAYIQQGGHDAKQCQFIDIGEARKIVKPLGH